jgi:hypothetical protein
MNDEFYWLAVALTTIVSVSRLTRLATWDEFPPVKWMRDKYADATDGGGWQILAFCGYCASFWIAGLVVAWGWWAGVYDPVSGNHLSEQVWWAVNGVLAASYLAAILMAHDGDDGDED